MKTPSTLFESTPPQQVAEASPKLDPTWLDIVGQEFQQPYMQRLKQFLAAERAAGKTIYPKGGHIFNALNTTPFDQVKVVILGQDPYHGPQQAHGLSFSVRSGIRFPPSLLNIFKELRDSHGMTMPKSGDLTPWAQQGVLLLNSVLTVEAHNAGSHADKGWESFTDRVIRALNDRRDGIVFMLWGSYARKKAAFVDRERHCVLEAPHPSPLSAHRGFLGCNHFKIADEYLESRGKPKIDWGLT